MGEPKYLDRFEESDAVGQLDPVVVRFRDGDVLHAYTEAWEEPKDGRLTVYLARSGMRCPMRATLDLALVEAVVVAGPRRERISLPPAV